MLTKYLMDVSPFAICAVFPAFFPISLELVFSSSKILGAVGAVSKKAIIHNTVHIGSKGDIDEASLKIGWPHTYRFYLNWREYR